MADRPNILWFCTDQQRHRLLKRCLDEVALSIDLGPSQVADY